MPRTARLLPALCAMLLLSSCAPLSSLRGPRPALALRHIHGDKTSCLFDCTRMVLGYYGLDSGFCARLPPRLPQSLLAMDSLVNGLADSVHRVQSFVLRRDGAFVESQIAKGRPVILIVKGREQYYHSVVVAGVSPTRRAFYVHDPAHHSGAWVRRDRLLKKWQRAGSVLVLIGLRDTKEHSER